MTTRKVWLVLATAATLLTACGREPEDPLKTPAHDAAGAPTAVTGTPSTDNSVPSASVALSGQPNGPQDAASGTRKNGTLTDAQESTAMPMAGQNNDHSAPLPPTRAASTR